MHNMCQSHDMMWAAAAVVMRHDVYPQANAVLQTVLQHPADAYCSDAQHSVELGMHAD